MIKFIKDILRSHEEIFIDSVYGLTVPSAPKVREKKLQRAKEMLGDRYCLANVMRRG